MKKSKKDINKSQAIRDYLADHPQAPPKAIKAALKEQGVDVSEGLVSVVKYGQKKKATGGAGAGRKKKKAPAAKAPRRAAADASALSAQDLVEVKTLVDRLGGVDRLKQALDVLEQLA